MKIDILIKPKEDCTYIERILKTAATSLNIPVQISKGSNFSAFPNLSVNFSQTPIVVINGNAEFVGKNLDIQAVKKKLAEINAH